MLLLTFRHLDWIDSDDVRVTSFIALSSPSISLKTRLLCELSVQPIVSDDGNFAEGLTKHAQVINFDLSLRKETYLLSESELLFCLLIAALIHGH